MRILPGALWVAYNIVHPEAIESMLPPHLRLSTSPLLMCDNDTDITPKLLFNAYHVRAPYMDGSRIDVQTLAHDPASDTLHLVILEVLTNTMDWNPRDGLRRTGNAKMEWDRGDDDIIMNAQRKDDPAVMISVEGALGSSVPIATQFAVDANRRCYFGNSPIGYSMTFSEDAVTHPVRPVRGTVSNTLWQEHRERTPTHVFMHSRAMDFDVAIPWRQIILGGG